jgi:hypothetical protein
METETKSVVAGTPTENLSWLAKQMLGSKRRVVIEDFHYLSEKERKRLAFDLKAFWDARVFFIIIGIWAQHDLMTYYNSDLTGRVEDIDLQWTDDELAEVLQKGEVALNIQFADPIRNEVLLDASQNVGLLQRLAERLCFESRITETMPSLVILDNERALAKARADISKALQQRYRQFSDAVTGGFKGRENTELKVYEHIVRVSCQGPPNLIRRGSAKVIRCSGRPAWR